MLVVVTVVGVGGVELQKTATGIFLPTSATSNPLPEATVIAVGPGAPDKEGRIVPTAVKTGDRVLLPGWGGNSIKVGEEVRSTNFSSLFFGGVGSGGKD
jgi:chaperonin GroES